MIRHKTTMRWDWVASKWTHAGWRMGYDSPRQAAIASHVIGRFGGLLARLAD